MDLESSIGHKIMGNRDKEESVDELIKKLNARGTKVKILTGDDAQTPQQNQSYKMSNADKENIPQLRRDTYATRDGHMMSDVQPLQ